MPRNYSRRTDVMLYTPEDLRIAMQAIRQGRKVREVARAFNIPESTFRKCKSLQDDDHLDQLRQPVFTKKSRTSIAGICFKMAILFYGLTHHFNHEKGLAGKDWLYGFLKRAPEISLQQSEGTTLNRIYSFNKKAVDTFYSSVIKLMEKFKFEANRVFSVDETGINTIQKKCQKVYGPK
nr:unnamed protein product [Callosobruchus chinensis]